MNENFSPNSTLAHYRILSKLGSGGMGEVYLAEDTLLGRLVALKILPPEFAQQTDRMNRFVREAKSASALNHPNIITIHEIGADCDAHFIASEYIEGETLHSLLRHEPPTLKSSLEIAIQIASALDAAHRAGIVHRDIKPENVIIRPDGLVKILDFGIAKLSELHAIRGESSEEVATALKSEGTSPGMIIGTAHYMSPEQARGKTVDARSDIFSFGIVFYELLSGKRPFDGENAPDVMGAVLHKEPVPIIQLMPDLPPEIERIVNKTLRKDREQRYQTAKDLLIDLKDANQELDFQNKKERTAAPQIRVATAVTSTNAKPPTSSAEFITQEVKKHKLSLVLGSVILLGLLALGVWFFVFRTSTNTGPIDSIAVLPFQNKGSDADTEYLSDGLAESLIYRLSQLPNLKVSPTSSVMRYKGRDTDITQIAKELEVDAIMSGRVSERGEDLTISVELVDARTRKLIWAEQYDRKMSDLLATQREIATTITQKLQLKLAGTDAKGITKRYTDSNEAYQLYLRGRYSFAKRTKDETLRAIEYFRQAINLDPKFALAYARLAETYASMPAYPYLSPKEAFPQAKAAAQKALELDPTLAEAHTFLAYSLVIYDWNWTEAEHSFKRAIELDPNNSAAHFRYGQVYLATTGHVDEAVAEIKRGLELEPLDINMGVTLAWIYFAAGRYDEALDQAKKTHDLEPNHPLGSWMLSQAYIYKGMYGEAISLNEHWLHDDPTNQFALRDAGIAYAKAGRRDKAEEMIGKFRELAKTQYVPACRIAGIYVALDDKDKAFAELDKSFEARDWELHRLNADPYWSSIRNEPRFKEMLKRLNLP
ncbi:MAG TPA: protein kinase [Pyrinomonadaceae bacterium]|nr:protein kinase [Pyrinomonadaceae bacterium]